VERTTAAIHPVKGASALASTSMELAKVAGEARER